jgi:hypothetical protein
MWKGKGDVPAHLLPVAVGEFMKRYRWSGTSERGLEGLS